MIAEKAKGQTSISDEELFKFLDLEYDYYVKLGCGEFVALPGVKKTLETLNSMPNVTVSLSTGNYDKIAWKKIEHAGVLPLFKERIGGFGDIEERSNILKFARKQAEELRGYKFDRHVHIGDAIQDVRAAQDANAVPVAVETGSKRKPDFPQPCFVIPNLEKGFDEFINIVKTGKPN
ncbi:putative hydrolase-like protein, putative [Trichomonas vaginalis G3]|uniref:Hypothetical hydrolase-like protein, putative n=1 Tax=Trichomonas vaginalis (strain ATCC PRA-98 / G3) TaxID=412133 RepID=A2FA79_TRIV3|nr:HAD-hyrolase-like family [Trichomonas vaginalis G3]EAX98215.1 putative hydrolase-like protein, putative [Trichomonas vaginalis G3]KAI5533979.1 HAD-hyrolase-like family [Trichomonas vaginalis G3]|eukprot:XP_001311145.1 hypothetical hydrolase-like protein [Trichomonas vaginalis G3]